MQTPTIIAILLSCLTINATMEIAATIRFTCASATTVLTSRCSVPGSGAPAITQILDSPNAKALDLRQAPHVPPAAPVPAVEANAAVLPTAIAPAVAVPASPSANLPAIPPGVAPAAPLEVPPAPPAAVPLTTNGPAVASQHEPGVSITVQWLETWIGTSRTWLPHTITLHNQPLSETAPLPGEGEIGMGTITGRLGVTRTVIQGAARTVGPEWKVGAMAAVGVGIAGIV